MTAKIILMLCTMSVLAPCIWAENCHYNDSLLCQSTRVISNLIALVRTSDKSIAIVPGFDIVSSVNSQQFDGRLNDIDKDSSLMDRIANYLQKHEVNIKISELFGKNQIMNVLKSVDNGKDIIEGRKKDKGYGSILALGLMMGKLLATLGIGSIGAIAMKALGVSMVALLLAAIIGLKSISEKNNDNNHHVQYVSSHDGHHRKRRDINPFTPLPYRGWIKTKNSNSKFV